ncbi:MAG: LacI family transcriptional regulator [Acidipropionibacterium sp.]|nr:LacI family transcriptional regulator [Acidipropionibacterium sp.]
MKDRAVVTLQDVAERSGVTRGTASLALSGKGRVAPKTRERVRQAAAELGYVANRVAQNLRAARSGVVGIYVPDRVSALRYYLDATLAAVRRGAPSDLVVTLLPADLAARSQRALQLDGYILIDPEDGDPVVERLLGSGRPTVSCEPVPRGLPMPDGLVFGDHARAVRTLLDHLWGRGARNPLLIHPPLTMAWGREVEAAHRAWCEEHQVEARTLPSSPGRIDELLPGALASMLGSDPAIDAVIGGPEGTALVAMGVARGLGRRIGVDLMLASCVDEASLVLMDPPITALDMAPAEVGAACMDLLLTTLEGSDHRPDPVEIPLRLLERGSTRLRP